MIKDKVYVCSEIKNGILHFLPQNSGHKNHIYYNANTKTFGLRKRIITDYLRAIKNAGVNAIESITTYNEPMDMLDKKDFGKLKSEEFFSYHKYVGNGKWDLSNFEQSFFDVMKEIIKIAVDGGNTFYKFKIVDHCIDYENNRPRNSVTGYGSFQNNFQGITTLYDDRAMPYILELINKCVKEFKVYNDFIVYELGNEIHGAKFAFSIYKRLVEKGIKPDRINLGINASIETDEFGNDLPHANDLKELRGLIIQYWRKKEHSSKDARKILRLSFWTVHGHLRKNGKMGFGKMTEWVIKTVNWMARLIGAEEIHDICIEFSTDGSGDGDGEKYPVPSVYNQRPSIWQWKKWLDVLFSEFRIIAIAGHRLIWCSQFTKTTDAEVQVPFFVEFNKIYFSHFKKDLYNVGKFPPIKWEDETPIEPVEPIEPTEPIIIEVPKEEIVKKIISFNKEYPFVHIKFNLIWERYKWYLIGSSYLAVFVLGKVI